MIVAKLFQGICDGHNSGIILAENNSHGVTQGALQLPELPEIYLFARDMQKELVGKKIVDIEIVQPKSLNVPSDVLVTNDTMPEKYRLRFGFADGSCLAVNFWWFGYAHWASMLTDHPMTAKLGPNALDLSSDQFRALLKGRRGAIKPFLLNQARIAGIGNVTVQDPLFRARIHPMSSIYELSESDIDSIYNAIHRTLREAIRHGGSSGELNLYGKHGSWSKDFFSVAYKTDEDCPACGSIIEKINTGSTSGYICPQCQIKRV